ncbi:type II secretion system minor pseudopilin GspJ [Sandarakinorhabdus sp. AAP62]|uniref:type II secretion system minor pseudopilin GspJ n=1 Tax=Sandarakinorhabdus sp. AAP62 TaxID=1248916 RepID=UPI0002E1B975|nr:type II secretion system minor pseudopilin GspJ [Sandarakinorhabdus sp. AAP62]
MREAGFTLIELLVGLFLFGLMAAAGTALLAGSVQASGQAQVLVGASGDLARLRALLTADAGQAAPRPWRDVEGRTQPAFSSNGGALFTLVRRGWANPGQAPRASLQRVEWMIDGDTLVRRSAAMVDGTAATQASVLAKGVKSARLRVLGQQGWQDGWAGQPGQLPRALELTLDGPQIGHVRQIVPMGPGGAA